MASSGPAALLFKALMLFEVTFLVMSTDLEVLLQFKHQVIGASNITSSWNLSSPCSSWEGVDCLADGITVANLTVSRVPISGTIPPILGQLKKLSSLDLSGNNLEGPIPSELGNCTSLVYLGLNGNKLSGKIPESITTLTSLQQLVLLDNQFSGPIPATIGNLKNLTFLGLRNNRLSGQLPKSISELESIQYMYLDENHFSGSIPVSLQKCQQLIYLALGNNSFTGNIPPELGSLTNLTLLYLRDNQLTGSIPSSFGNLPRLEDLKLTNNHLSGVIPDALGQLGNLQYLYVDNNSLTGTIPDLANCTALLELNLASNNLTGGIPPSLASLPLERLWLYNNLLTGKIPDELGRNSNLSVVYISNNTLQGPIPSSLCAQRALRRVYLHDNNLNGSITKDLLECPTLERLLVQNNMLSGYISARDCGPNLQYLDFSSNQFSGSIPPFFSGCKNLTALFLSKNSFSGQIPSQLPTSLQQLVISDNLLAGEIPPAFAPKLFLLDLSHNKLTTSLQQVMQFIELKHLFLQGNQLSGPFPADICRTWRSLNDLNLGSNDLSGPIPSNISCLKALNSLDMSSNKLSGEIPPQLGSLQLLELLNLSHNQLSSQIPNQLSNLVSLEKVDLSYNQLMGPLPGAWISKFYCKSPACFAGNPGLWLDSTTCSNASKISKHRSHGVERGIVVGGVLAATVLAAAAAAAAAGWWHWRRKISKTGRGETAIYFTDKVISAEAIIRATDNYSEKYVVGEGSYGVVYKGVLEDGQLVAVKKLKTHDMDDTSSFREWSSAGQIKHRNIIRLRAFYKHKGTHILVSDWMQNGNVRNLLEAGELASWYVRFRIALGTAHGLAYLHHDCVPKIVHRDIKASNILLDDELEPKIADFGLAKLIEKHAVTNTMSFIAGTWGYIAPEYAYTLKVDEKSDVYSFGILLLELLVGKSPVDRMFAEQGVDIVTWVKDTVHNHGLAPVVDSSIWASSTEDQKLEMGKLLKLALFCANNQPYNRPTMREAVEILTSLDH